jgi:hypothetical protein
VVGKIVDRDLDGAAVLQVFDVRDEEPCFQGFGMVEINFRALGGRQAAQVFVIGIVLQEGDSGRAHTLQDLLCNGGLA